MAANAPAKLGYRTTALEALRGADLRGKVAVVTGEHRKRPWRVAGRGAATGGNSGIGLETCRALAHAGADVILCSRSVEAGERAAAELQGLEQGKLTVKQLDLSDLMGTNHFGHFYLTQLLLPKMNVQGTPGRIIAVASIAHAMVKGLPLEDLNCQTRTYYPWLSYAHSKLANVLFVTELARQLEKEGSAVKAFSVHPGVINTNLHRHKRVSSFCGMLFGPLMKTVPQGAATTIYAATAPELEQDSGAYLALCKVGRASKAGRDSELAKAFWRKSEELLEAALARAGLSS
ncbi:short-chain dehydrogenase TIC chloroplastic-like [Micractinium conductrix]|uniref:Short-chain dehydrogenase TIC chloroplastic-like n=1 Tax=Micractinium conductrix TaxID=554055 RepID=A0A2P6VCQ2_9CHLO|nr:short-chain dehydrogenase TIC chloroplastic-like [Micractinium conductrix]|eukprot:PSC71857.1 short-chain dehydrogenase TIC chloroplastic-like [Micractinium conductrix]